MKTWLAFLLSAQLTALPFLTDNPFEQNMGTADANKPPSIETHRDGEQFTLSWGPHPSTAYQLEIVDSYEQEQTWNVIYEASYPDNETTGVLYTETHPQATTTIPEEYTNINLLERKDEKIFRQLPTTTINEAHTWTLNFDETLLDEDVSNDLIYIKNEENERIENVILISTPSELKILPPSEGYEEDSLYRLYVDPSLQNINEEPLQQGYKQTFYVDSDDETAEHEWQPPNSVENNIFTFKSSGDEEENEEENVSEDEPQDERVYSVFPIEADDEEHPRPFIIRHLEPAHEEIIVPPVSIPAYFIPANPLLPFPHQYSIRKLE